MADDHRASTTNADVAARVEPRLREAADGRLAVLLDGMSEAVLVVDPDRQVVMTNRAYDAYFGTAKALIPEDGSGNRLPKAEWPQVRAASGETFSMTFTCALPGSGERRWYEANGRPGGEWGSVIVIRDITDRSLRHLQERFIDTASHELQTPLAALRNYLLLVEREVGPTTSPAAGRYLAGAIEQSGRLVELASRLFDASVIRNGRTVITHGPVDLVEVVRRAAAEAESADASGRVRVKVPRTHVIVEGDAMRLGQLVGNLLANALTHGGSDEPVDMALARSATSAVVTIADRGPGIPDDVRATLFAPFSAAAPEGHEGLGLGLYLAQAFTTEHGGTLTLKARIEGGTVARLTLPLPPRRGRSGA
jgi:two-component system CheB/CheR fusion protein